MKGIWTVVQREADKSKATAESKALERAVADCGRTGYGKVLAGYQRGWGHEKPTQKEIMYGVGEQLWDKGKEEAG